MTQPIYTLLVTQTTDDKGRPLDQPSSHLMEANDGNWNLKHMRGMKRRIEQDSRATATVIQVGDPISVLDNINPQAAALSALPDNDRLDGLIGDLTVVALDSIQEIIKATDDSGVTIPDNVAAHMRLVVLQWIAAN